MYLRERSSDRFYDLEDELLFDLDDEDLYFDEFDEFDDYAIRSSSKPKIKCPRCSSKLRPESVPAPGKYEDTISRSGGLWYLPEYGDNLWKIAKRELFFSNCKTSGSNIKRYMNQIKRHPCNKHLIMQTGSVTKAFLVKWNRVNRCTLAKPGERRGYAMLFLPVLDCP